MSLELVSVHFPKAAGTSLATALRAHYGDAFAIDYTHDPVNPDHRLSDRTELASTIRAIHGHFRGDRYSEHRSAMRITFLREPVDNLISIYYFWQEHPAQDPTHARFLAEQPTVLEFAERFWPLRRLMSLTYFGGVDMSSFDFIGFHDTRREDLARLSEKLGIPIEADLHVNRTSPNPARAALVEDRVTMNRLRDLLADDVDFYERARELRS